MNLPNQCKPVSRDLPAIGQFGEAIMPQVFENLEFGCHGGMLRVRDKDGGPQSGKGFNLRFPCKNKNVAPQQGIHQPKKIYF